MSARYLTSARLAELHAKLHDRDRAVLRAVTSLRAMSGDQLTRLCFIHADDPPVAARAGRRALLRLVRLDVLARLPRPIGGIRAGSAGFVYRLGPAGQRLAAEYGWQQKRRTRRSLTPGSLFLRHTLAISELHVRLRESDRSGRFELLTLEAEPACWRSWDGRAFQRAVLKPDSFVRLGLGAYEDSYFIEVDRGTEGSRALDRQMQAYAAYHRSGVEQAAHGVFPKVLWTTPSAQRGAVIAETIRRQPKEARELFTVVPFDEVENVMTAAT
jgi:hypothetical protein